MVIMARCRITTIRQRRSLRFLCFHPARQLALYGSRCRWWSNRKRLFVVRLCWECPDASGQSVLGELVVFVWEIVHAWPKVCACDWSYSALFKQNRPQREMMSWPGNSLGRPHSNYVVWLNIMMWCLRLSCSANSLCGSLNHMRHRHLFSSPHVAKRGVYASCDLDLILLILRLIFNKKCYKQNMSD